MPHAPTVGGRRRCHGARHGSSTAAGVPGARHHPSLATLHDEASGLGTASITTSDPAEAVQVTPYDNNGQRCFGIGVDNVADVRVGVGANAFSATTAKTHGLVTVKVGDKTRRSPT